MNDTREDLIVGGGLFLLILFFVILIMSVGLTKKDMKTDAPSQEPIKLESPERPSAGKINNVLSKHHPELFNYCDRFKEDMKNEVYGNIVTANVKQSYGVTNENEISYIHIECEVQFRAQMGLFTFNDYIFETKTNKFKFKQVHDEYNRLVHLIKL